jgi:hypothetical protein
MGPTRALFRSWAWRLRASSSLPGRALRPPLVAGLVAVALSSGACGGTSTEPPVTTAPTTSDDSSVAHVYVALGDALTAGMVSNALVETHQAYSFPAQIARQAATEDFQQPLVSTPGIDVELELLRFYQGPISIAPKAATRGAPLNASLAGPYNNLGVPGAKAADLTTATETTSSYHSLVLRSLGTAFSQCVRLRPSLVTLWIGNSDVLAAIVGGRAVDGVTLTRMDAFKTTFEQNVRSLASATGATIIVANIPDFTKAPFATAFKPYVVDPTTGEPKLQGGQRIPLIGPGGTALASSALVTLAASDLLANGDGIPVAAGGTGKALPDEVVLDQNEVDIIREHVGSYNRSIDEVCAEASIPVVDLHAFFESLVSSGRLVGGTRLDGTFLTGGVYSYDGIHLTDLGYALVANEWIQTIDQNGGAIPLINLSPIMSFRSSAAKPTGVEPTPPFRFTREAYTALLGVYPSAR